ncbi:MAG TPA: L,D-transpeptidase family protein [Mucilaginibacter sp.]|nr:L,D-transpeptidase family protein [Mucilaginibacter sp.]
MKSSYINFILFVILLSSVLDGCGRQPGKIKGKGNTAKAWDQTIPGNFSGQSTAVFDGPAINRFFKEHPDIIASKDQLQIFYSKRKFAYAWFDAGKLIEQAGNLYNRVNNLQKDGIYRSIPYREELDSLFTAQGTQKHPDLRLELMLTAQYFAFSKLAWGGLDSSASTASGWYLPRKKLDYDPYLDSLLKTTVRQFSAEEPVYRQYELLKGFLRKYRDLDAGDSWLPIRSTKLLKPGDVAPVLSQIKTRLFKLNDFRGDTSGTRYDDSLVAAVKQFQDRHGLTINGQLNRATMNELNVPLKSRIRQILVNMERSRWLPVTLNGNYLAVNIPEFKLHVYHADSLLWSCNVVVGQTMHQTTLFYGEIKQVVFSPYWNVPPSIVRNEIIPGIKKDTGYISKHDMEITGQRDGLPVVRQKPGPENSLGLVKFLFPNSYDIYLHDTPSKSLFGETSRAFSHGCIRIMEPVKLANFLLKNSKEWDPEKIDQAMHTGKEQYVNLRNRVPVFIAYFTAFTDRNHCLNFRKDIYNLDEHLASMILSGKGVY